MKKVKHLSLSAIVVILLVTSITIGGELYAPLKNLLAKASGHHWVTKSILSLILFIFFGFIFKKTFKKEGDVLNYVKFVIWTTFICTLAMSAFFVWHYFKAA